MNIIFIHLDDQIFWKSNFNMVGILDIDILGTDILGVDILGKDILALPLM